MSVGTYVTRVLNDRAIADTTKDVCLAALYSVNALKWINDNTPNFADWELGENKYGADGLNCWNALFFWAFQGAAISKAQVMSYSTALANSPRNAHGVAEVSDAVKRYLGYDAGRPAISRAQPGAAVFFSVPGRELSHVVFSIGGTEVVSNWQINAHRAGLARPEIARPQTVVMDIPTLRDVCGGASCRVTATPGPWWTQPGSFA